MQKQSSVNLQLPEKIYYSIGEVKDITGLEPHVLRYWETEFTQLKPKKNNRGQRTYQKKDIEHILVIKDLLYTKKFTIAGARKAMKKGTQIDFAVAEKEEKMTVFLKRVHNELLSLSKTLKGENTDDLFSAE